MACLLRRGLAALALAALVLVPGTAAYSSVLDALLQQKDTTMAYMAYASSPLAADLSDPSLVATVFVPRDAAYQSGYSALMVAAGPQASKAAEATIAYSVVPGEALAPSDLEAGIKLQTLLSGASITIASTDASSDNLGSLRVVSASNQAVGIESDYVKAGKASIIFVDQLLVPSSLSYGVGGSDALGSASLGGASISVSSDWAAPAPELE